jgi:hypothetical protein
MMLRKSGILKPASLKNAYDKIFFKAWQFFVLLSALAPESAKEKLTAAAIDGRALTVRLDYRQAEIYKI